MWGFVLWRQLLYQPQQVVHWWSLTLPALPQWIFPVLKLALQASLPQWSSCSPMQLFHTYTVSHTYPISLPHCCPPTLHQPHTSSLSTTHKPPSSPQPPTLPWMVTPSLPQLPPPTILFDVHTPPPPQPPQMNSLWQVLAKHVNRVPVFQCSGCSSVPIFQCSGCSSVPTASMFHCPACFSGVKLCIYAHTVHSCRTHKHFKKTFLCSMYMYAYT